MARYKQSKLICEVLEESMFDNVDGKLVLKTSTPLYINEDFINKAVRVLVPTSILPKDFEISLGFQSQSTGTVTWPIDKTIIKDYIHVFKQLFRNFRFDVEEPRITVRALRSGVFVFYI